MPGDELRSHLATLDRAVHHIGPFGAGFITVSSWIAILFWKGNEHLIGDRWGQLSAWWWWLLLLWTAWALASVLVAGELRRFVRRRLRPAVQKLRLKLKTSPEAKPPG